MDDTKIHKKGVPLRPIVDYNVSRELAEISQTVVGKTEHQTANS